MQLRYKSDFPNQVHQLNVYISQHYHLLLNDTIKWQAKKLDVNWGNLGKTGKEHLVTFIIRDHFSNCFYAELYSVDKMPLIQDFLFNAWTKKEHYPFFGMPTTLIVPKITQEQFPSIKTFFSKLKGIYMQAPTSGFSSAVASIQQWERMIAYFTSAYSNCKTLTQFQENIQLINREANTFDIGKGENNLQKWLDNSPQIIDVSAGKVKFYKAFE